MCVEKKVEKGPCVKSQRCCFALVRIELRICCGEMKESGYESTKAESVSGDHGWWKRDQILAFEPAIVSQTIAENRR
jgi:hypothetical protein